MNIDLLYKIALTFIPHIGDVLAKNLISYCGSEESVFKKKREHLKKIPGIGNVIADAVLAGKEAALQRAEKEIKFIEKYKIEVLFYTDKNYPSRLKHCSDSPLLLYYKGNADLNNQKIVGIVGTRKASLYGKQFCEELVEKLSKHDVLIVSGLAYGIDICAHKESLKNNLQTIGVLAHGLDRIYPDVHKPIAEEMIKSGGLLTEFPSKTNPDRENFPKRNRIVAGMCDAIVVVETAKRGGALITAEIANSYNRDVFALPGRIKDQYSEGCNFLIKTHKASLIESASDIEYLLRWENRENNKSVQKQLFKELTIEEKKIVEILEKEGKIGIDSIALKSQMPMSQTAGVLLTLEMSGIVKSLPGKLYELY